LAMFIFRVCQSCARWGSSITPTLAHGTSLEHGLEHGVMGLNQNLTPTLRHGS